MVDGVFRSRFGTVAAVVGDFEGVIGVEFFAGFNSQQQFLAVFALKISGVGIQDVFGVDQIAMVAQQPVDAVVVSAFLVGGKRQDQVAIRFIAFFLEAQHHGHQYRVAVFHVGGAAAVEIAIFFQKPEGIDGPVF